MQTFKHVNTLNKRLEARVQRMEEEKEEKEENEKIRKRKIMKADEDDEDDVQEYFTKRGRRTYTRTFKNA